MRRITPSVRRHPSLMVSTRETALADSKRRFRQGGRYEPAQLRVRPLSRQ
jgi:hypothetical protein